MLEILKQLLHSLQRTHKALAEKEASEGLTDQQQELLSLVAECIEETSNSIQKEQA